MNWYKTSNRLNRFRILYEDSWGNLELISETGKKYTYKNISLFFIEKIKKLTKQNRWGEAWQLLRRLENRQ